MTAESIGQLNRIQGEAGIGDTAEIYPGTIHGFTMADTEAFNASALRRHWDRLLPILDRALADG